MEAIEITIEERVKSGTTEGMRLRKAGLVPGVVYQGGKPAQMVTMTKHDYSKTISGRSSGQLYKFKSSTKGLTGQLALVKDLQIEPIKGEVLHLDFLAVDENKPIKVSVALETKGECLAVKNGEAVLNMSVHELDIECLPTKIPSALYIDITALTLGHSLHVKDIELPEGTKMLSSPELSIVSAVAKREEEIVTAAPVADAAAAAAPGTTPTAPGTAPAAAGPAKGAAPAKK